MPGCTIPSRLESGYLLGEGLVQHSADQFFCRMGSVRNE